MWLSVHYDRATPIRCVPSVAPMRNRLLQRLAPAQHNHKSDAAPQSPPRPRRSQSARARPHTPGTMRDMIEVERKFKLTPQALAALAALSPVRETRFRDVYYAPELAETDRWLRRRDGVWELKVPVGAGGSAAAATTVYREVVGAEAVWAELGRVEEREAGLVPYASLTTRRSALDCRWRGSDVTVVVDRCTSPCGGFSHGVGEIETLVADEADVARAMRVVEEVALHYGLEIDAAGFGKLPRFLQENKPELYDRLICLGVIATPA